MATTLEQRKWIKFSFMPLIFTVARGMRDKARAFLLATDNTTIVEQLKNLK